MKHLNTPIFAIILSLLLSCSTEKSTKEQSVTGYKFVIDEQTPHRVPTGEIQDYVRNNPRSGWIKPSVAANTCTAP